MLFILASCTSSPPETPTTPEPEPPTPVELRVATFNASLYGDDEGDISVRLADSDDTQAQGVAAILQIVRPDIVLVNELDVDSDGNNAAALNTRYFAVSQGGREPLDYPFVYVADSNTGVHSGQDLDQDGSVVSTPGSNSYGDDAFGFGTYPGQYGFAVFSRYPLETPRTFQTMLWTALPDAQIPPDFYSPEALGVMRLSSKNHVDLPITVGDHTLHLLASHPTPPGFDGEEDRNGRRNADEIRLWAHYLDAQSDSPVDDAGLAGGLDAEAHFVVAGDLNADPNDGGSRDNSIASLLEHPRVVDTGPTSAGALEQSESQGGRNSSHDSPPEQDTADFNDQTVGNVRADYVLPSASITVRDSGVFWPASTEPDFDLVGTFPFPVTDHRPVWVDLTLE